jgi:thymidylate kinase
VLLALEGIAGAGKSTLRDRLLADAHAEGMSLSHTGQFSWLSQPATRTIVRLRAGQATDADPDEATEAACWDLTLHARFNLAPALVLSPVLADRFTLSTACMLALLHKQPVSGYIERLAEKSSARPQLTVLLTTPPAACQTRIARRATARRFTEHPATAARLADLYQQAATAWTRTTGLPVLRHPCTTRDDLDALAATCLDHLREATRPQSSTTGIRR